MVSEADRQKRDSGTRWLPVAAGAAAISVIALGLLTNWASSLVSQKWIEQNAGWVVGSLALLALATVAWAVHSSRPQPAEAVTFTSVEPLPAPAQQEDQIRVGDLPGTPPAFVARDAVDRLAEVFEKGGGVASVSALTGGRGAGKTQVAAQYARQAAAEGVSLVAWVSADDHDRLLAGLSELADRLGVADPEGDSEVSAKRARDALAARTAPSILVLDNATDPDVVRPYLPTTGATRVIITSNDQAFARLGEGIDVGVFDPEQSIAYLQQRTGLNDETGAKAVAAELGDLPLALAQAATVLKLKNLTYTAYLEQLASVPLDEILPADRGDAYPHGVAGAILLSVEAVQAADATGLTERVLESVALLAAEGVSQNVLADVVGEERLDDVLVRLVEASLLVWAKDRHAVVMHRLVGRAIRDRMEKSGELEAALASVTEGIEPRLVPEERAWEQRAATAEIVAHAIAIWDGAVNAADRGVFTAETVAAHVDLAHWAVRHLRAIADLSRATQVGVTMCAASERVLGPEHLDTLAFNNNLAGAYESAGDLTRAIPIYEETFAACERIFGPDHPGTLTSRNNLAGAYESAGDLTRAIPIYEETLAACERIFGPDHPDTLSTRNNLAYAYESAGDLTRAIPIYEDTLAARERMLGPEHPDTLSTRNNLAYAYQAAGDLTRAIPIYEETLAARERILGPDHPDTLTSRNNLAYAYESAGDLTRAIPIYEDTLAARERTFGPDHPDTLTSRNNLAGAYESAGDLTRAIPIYEETLAARERILGPEHPTPSPPATTSRTSTRPPATSPARSRSTRTRSPPASGSSAPTTPRPLLPATTSQAPTRPPATSPARSRSTRTRSPPASGSSAPSTPTPSLPATTSRTPTRPPATSPARSRSTRRRSPPASGSSAPTTPRPS